MTANAPLLDPLRPARKAVQAGEFGMAVEQLAALREPLNATPEWALLMAIATWRMGEFSRSHRLSQRARDAYRSRGDTDGEMRAQNVAAAGALARGKLGQAETGFRRALHLAKQLRDTLSVARCTNNLGGVSLYRGETDSALVLYGNAANLFEQIGSLRGVAEAWHNAGVAWRELGDFSAAKKATDRAVDAAEALGNDRLLGQTLSGRGETDALLGDRRLGNAQVERALALSREHTDRMTEAASIRVLGLIARGDGDIEAATQLGETAVELATEIGNDWMCGKAHQELGNTFKEAGSLEAARAEFEVAAAAFQRLDASSRADDMRQLAVSC